MSTFSDRVQAVRALAKSSGKPIDQLLGAVAESWGLDAVEFARLAHELKQPAPSAPNPAAVQAAQAAAAAAEQEQHTADVLAFREYQRARSQNPFVAAEYRLANGAQIERGQQLDTPPSEPPKTAA
jgi:hypothetical protein